MYTLNALQLYAVTKAESLRNERSYAIFEDFSRNLNAMNDEGLVLVVNGVEKRYGGFLAYALGDTPAMNWLGGFKETVGCTFKYCRKCEVTFDRNELSEGEFRKELSRITISRKLVNHLATLNKMKSASIEDNLLTSKNTGINYPSVLLAIKDFDICQCLLQDPMHILYEGICHLELSSLLNNLILIKKIFKLDFLNDKIKNFKYVTADRKDIPNLVDRKYYSRSVNESGDGFSSYNKFSQSSGQMSTLFQNLPLMIGEKLNGNENWNNFLR